MGAISALNAIERADIVCGKRFCRNMSSLYAGMKILRFIAIRRTYSLIPAVVVELENGEEELVEMDPFAEYDEHGVLGCGLEDYFESHELVDMFADALLGSDVNESDVSVFKAELRNAAQHVSGLWACGCGFIAQLSRFLTTLPKPYPFVIGERFSDRFCPVCKHPAFPYEGPEEISKEA